MCCLGGVRRRATPPRIVCVTMTSDRRHCVDTAAVCALCPVANSTDALPGAPTVVPPFWGGPWEHRSVLSFNRSSCEFISCFSLVAVRADSVGVGERISPPAELQLLSVLRKRCADDLVSGSCNDSGICVLILRQILLFCVPSLQ